LATFCFNARRPKQFADQKVTAQIITNRNFEKIYEDISVNHLDQDKERVKQEFIGSYSWLVFNQNTESGHRHIIYYPQIYCNPNKIKEAKGDHSFRELSWILHEIAHIILHFELFLIGGIVSVKLASGGCEMEEDAWLGAKQLFDALCDCKLIYEIERLPETNRGEYIDKIIREIFETYQYHDTTHTQLRTAQRQKTDI